MRDGTRTRSGTAGARGARRCPSAVETLDGNLRAARECLLARGEGRYVAPAAVELRRTLFGLVVLAMARERERVAPGGCLGDALDTYRIAARRHPGRDSESILTDAFDVVRDAVREGTAETVIGAYEMSLRWPPLEEASGPKSRSERDSKPVGAIYTPPDVAVRLLQDGLEPTLLEAAELGSEAVRALRICDPACGAGAFLLASLRRVAAVLADIEGIAYADAASAVLRDCIHGVDLDPGAVELCRGLAWLETSLPWSELRRLRGFRCGNSLLGTTPALAAADRKASHVALFSSHAASDRAESAWCRRFVSDPHCRFFHWHVEFPDVFSERRGRANPRTGAAGGFDCVVGNPPFQNQLESESAHAREIRELLRARFDGATGGYADSAVAFLLLGTELLRAGGRCTLIAPQSILATRDAHSARCRLAETTTLEAIWVANEHAFGGASVHVVAPTLRAEGGARVTLSRTLGVSFVAAPPIEVDMDALARTPTWSRLVSDMLGVPRLQLREHSVVGDEAVVTADFRDQFYGLRGRVIEDAELRGRDARRFPPLVTTGLVDLAACHWSARSARYAGVNWNAPRVDLGRLEQETELGAWAGARLVPKLLLATQTRALEVVVDAGGAWIPMIPLISILPHDPSRVWHLAAALAAPPTSAHAATEHAGTALSVGAIKLSASQVRSLPLPKPGPAWDEAAELFRAAQGDGARRLELLAAFARCMCEAWELRAEATSELLAWWLPRVRGPAR